MSEIEERPEPDRLEGAPHPRETQHLLGQDQAEEEFLQVYNSGRLHHGWLITGPRGVGKATLAWRIARFLLSQPMDADDGGLFGDAPLAPTSLDLSPDHPIMRRTMAGSEPRLFLLRRGWNEKVKPARLQSIISVEEVRKLKSFFALSAAEGGRRVVIVDAADEMNTAAANALLKLLEEPPEGAVILMVSHQPSRLLPTIRSRCRELRCRPLAPEALNAALAQTDAEVPDHADALADLAAGSVGTALRLTQSGGLETYAEIVTLMSDLPRLNRPRAIALADSASGKAAAERFELLLQLMDLFLSRLARAGAGLPPRSEAAPGEHALFARLCPTPQAARLWADLQQQLSARARHGQAVNLDPAALILDMVLKVNETAGRTAA